MTAGVYIHEDKSIFEMFRSHAGDIEKELGLPIEWRDAKKASRFMVSRPFDINKHEDWDEGFAWLYEMCMKIRIIIKKYDK